jgi:uncharacterized SAM-binding protein YcdF (DUF218 family)
VTTVLRRPSGREGAASRRERRPHPVRRWLLRLGLLAVVLVVGYVAVTFAQVWWASRHDRARAADAIVVLGAAQYNCRPSPVLEQRLDHALALYHDGIARRLVVTGGKRQGDRCTEADTSAAYLEAAGVPSSAILREDRGSNTWESLAAAARILRDRDMTRAVLVTNGYHALRAEAIAGELGLHASVSPSHRGGTMRDYLEETAAVSLGRVIGFGRLVDLDDQVESQIDTPIATTHSSGSGG